jgi:5-methylcytosine-specific restriction endonuclease McrA
VRTPNTQCLICGKPLYRRPSDMARVRYAACIAHRAEAQKVAGITEAQHAGLRLGRPKGTNHRTGYKHKAETRSKMAETRRRWCADNPDRVVAAGAKTRAELHRLWKGGITKLNKSIRQMRENRRWMDAVKARDGKCIKCGSTDHLESHHLVELGDIIAQMGIRSRDDARKHAAVLWDMENGITLCEACHYAEHGRLRREAA